MSLNHFSPSEIHQETTHWWNNSTQQNLQPPSSFTMDTSSAQLNHMHNPDSQQQIVVDDGDKETMFGKPLTPSDVGKLNRLVIPKQHAEKYFPLSGGGGDSGAEKGLLLSFEDEAGKCWRFRYSYWNSSQSYVLTKGWSRYVKEKRLDAGDVVLFERRRNDIEHLFIGWRRRAGQDNSSQHGASGSTTTNTTSSLGHVNGGGESGGGTNWTRMFYSPAPQSYPHQHHQSAAAAVSYSPDYHLHHAATGSPVNQTPSSSSGGNSRILRLFGVNLECQQQQEDELYSEPSTPDGSSLSSQGPTHHQLYPINNNSTTAYYGDNRMVKKAEKEANYWRWLALPWDPNSENAPEDEDDDDGDDTDAPGRWSPSVGSTSGSPSVGRTTESDMVFINMSRNPPQDSSED